MAPFETRSIDITLTPQQWKNIRTVSLERMINNAILTGERGEREFKEEMHQDHASILWQDFDFMKSTLMAIWHAVHSVAMTKTE